MIQSREATSNRASIVIDTGGQALQVPQITTVVHRPFIIAFFVALQAPNHHCCSTRHPFFVFITLHHITFHYNVMITFQTPNHHCSTSLTILCLHYSTFNHILLHCMPHAVVQGDHSYILTLLHYI